MAAQLKATRIDMKTLRQIGSRKIGLLALFAILAFTRLSYGAEDVAFFEKRYQTKLSDVKPIQEYDDPDKFYSAIAKQLGIPELAMEAAAKKFGWQKDDGKATKAIVKRAPGKWQVMILRFAISTNTKKPDPATLQMKAVAIDDDKNVTFPEMEEKKP
jgi:hypothetical protein